MDPTGRVGLGPRRACGRRLETPATRTFGRPSREVPGCFPKKNRAGRRRASTRTARTIATRTVALASTAAIRVSSSNTIPAQRPDTPAHATRHSTPRSLRSSALCSAQIFAIDVISSAAHLSSPIDAPMDAHVSATARRCSDPGRFTHDNICASAAARSRGSLARVAARAYRGSSSARC